MPTKDIMTSQKIDQYSEILMTRVERQTVKGLEEPELLFL